MQWGAGKTFQKVAGENYEIEHILEWQMVTKFFDWLSKDKYKSARQFPNPAPLGKNKVDFCTYWKQTWDTPAFVISANSKRAPKGLTAKTHLAYQYPGKDPVFNKEFVWLQEDLNAPAKQHMWTRKKTNQIYGLTKAKTAIRRNPTDAATQAMRAKYLLGAVKYMKDSTVERYFIAQKKRIGEALDQIDNALPNAPTNKGRKPWTKQDLKKHWNEYMNDAFTKAKSRTDNTMDTMIAELEAKWVMAGAKKPAGAKGKTSTAQTTLVRQIKALKSEWLKQKRGPNAWTQPNW
ncbi:hypothetical protein SLS60_003805 [Paraconiothyrium brasiliense]|uniref:Uncharacterized protein n=1 Tax=Paraconiothyrium brasiliense TaxID=300254 RepID=A0ABR3RR65_9PLEO